MNYDIIIPMTIRNVCTFELGVNYIKRYLHPQKIVVICNETVGKIITSKNIDVNIINEDQLIGNLSFEVVRNIIIEQNDFASKRTGWYFQQFLKLAYAYICQEDYYMTWDADTIPLREIDMFCNETPYFDVKEEYNKPYFTLIKKILKIDKCCEYSFISEHMMLKKSYVLEMIDRIEKDNSSGVEKYYEIILRNIHNIDLEGSGFSEFETYGTYVLTYHKNDYLLRKVKSLRDGEYYLGNNPSLEMIDWAAESYDILTIENRLAEDNNRTRRVTELKKHYSLQEIVLNKQVLMI